VFLLGDFCYCRSFAETCSRIQGTLQSKVFLLGDFCSCRSFAEKDDLVRLLFNAVEVVYSVRPLRDHYLLHFLMYHFGFC
jgi:hypothetical protein